MHWFQKTLKTLCFDIYALPFKGLTGSYLDDDDDDDENSVSISKLKNKYKADKQGKSGAQKAPIYSSDR